MKDFTVKRMWKFSKLQLKELFFYKKSTELIKLLFLHSFSICLVCVIINRDSLRECLSMIEQLLILFSFYFSFLTLLSDMLSDERLINKFVLPVTYTEKYVSLYFSTILIGSLTLLANAILSNILMQLVIPLFFTEEVGQGYSFILGGGGNDFSSLLLRVVVTFFVTILTSVGMLRKQYDKMSFRVICVLFLLSYLLPVLLMFGLGISKTIVRYGWGGCTIVWSVVFVIMTYKGFRKQEFEE